MDYSAVGIINISLAWLGEDPIRDEHEDTKRARLSLTFFEPTKDYLLSRFDWPFARAYKVLQRKVVQPDEIPFGTYAYQLPVDCKTPRELHPLGSRDAWEVIGPHLFCDLETVGLYYTTKDVPITEISDTFANLLALALAARMSPSLTQDSKLTKTLQDLYLTQQREDWESDANIGNTYREFDEDPNNDTFVSPGLIKTPGIIT